MAEKTQTRPAPEPGTLRESRVVHINRVAKVVKGGRRFSFTALVVVGDGDGRVGLGYGAREELRRGVRVAKVRLRRGEIRRVEPLRLPIAGGAARIILEEAGIHDVLAKSLGSSNAINVARATINGLRSLQRPDDVARRRGIPAESFVPKALLRAYNERKKSG